MLKGYSPPAIFRRERDQQGGGVAIFVKSGIDHKILKLPNSNLETVGMRIFGTRKNIDIINIYAPKSAALTETELNKLSNNLENNVVILGDFNSHNRLWEHHCNSNNEDKKSEEIIKFMTNKNLTLLNNGAYTRHDVHANTFSAIDLTFTNPALSIRCNWTVHDNLMGSDHFPIVTEIEQKITFNDYAHVPKWKLDKADWHQFRTILKHKGITIDDEADLDQCNEKIIEAILDASNETIPKTKHFVRCILYEPRHVIM